MTVVLFVVAAGLGTATRLGVSRRGATWLNTLIVNVSGSFLLGWLLALDPHESTVTVVGIGFLGSLTTFSMFALEATEGSPSRRVTILASTLVSCLAAVSIGHALG